MNLEINRLCRSKRSNGYKIMIKRMSKKFKDKNKRKDQFREKLHV